MNNTEKSMKRLVAIGLWMLVFMPLNVMAQEEDLIITDRPDLTESPETVGHLRLQIETGLNWERSSLQPRERLLAFGTLLRFGFSDDFELRLAGDTYSRLSTDFPDGTVSSSGFAPVEAGIKYTFLKGAAMGEPTVAILMHVELPSGSDAFRTETASPSFTLAGAWDVSEIFSLGVNLGVDNQSDDGGNYYAAFASASMGIGLNDRWGMFFELAGRSANSSAGEATLLADAGFTYLATPNLQFDCALGTGLSGEMAPELLLTTGMSVRF